jgi:hypothetical protein
MSGLVNVGQRAISLISWDIVWHIFPFFVRGNINR